jgi:hypothetical protein
MPPRWLMIVGSVAISFHLLTLGFQALAAPSGPWPEPPPIGSSPMPPPVFAATLHYWTGPWYLPPLKLTNNYHFVTNNTNGIGIELEARLTDRDGNQVVVKLPDEDANFWVRQRETLLAAGLGDDMPFVPQGAPKVAPEGQTPRVLIWERPEGETKERLKEEEEQKLSRVAPTMQPNRLALILADSYARYLCRKYDVKKVELIRHYQSRIPPAIMFPDQQPMPGEFSKRSSYFGELPR